MRDPIIFAIDIDGVACAHADAICRYVGETRGVECAAGDVTSWDHDFGGITFTEAVEEAYPDPQFILGMKVTPGFQPFLAELCEVFEGVFVSTRKPYCHEPTRRWIKQMFGAHQVKFTCHKDKVHASYLLDDNPDDVLGFANAGKTGFLLRQPWNDHEENLKPIRAHPRCHFARSFGHVLGKLGEFGELASQGLQSPNSEPPLS